MLKKIKKLILKSDEFLYKKFGSSKSIKVLENIKEAEVIFSYLNTVGEKSKVRFVGGCIRKALCGEQVDDIDLATSLEPNAVKEKLLKNNVKVIDTGIEHGTLTAIINKKKFEITTLRKDLKTDGRHADVEFTLNWEEDASRRDFTINAIYADIEGRIFDPLNGRSDLKNKLIKFIGSPEERIQEDYLRILRYFRFFLQYSDSKHDEGVLKSIKKNINGINHLSKERIFDELKKILILKNSYKIFAENKSREIILNIFPQFKYHERLMAFNMINGNIKKNYDSCLILALLVVDKSNNHEYFCHKYKTSNIVKKRLSNISQNFENIKIKNFFSIENIKKKIYLLGKNSVIDLLLFSLCLNKFKNINILELIKYTQAYKMPKFPISGNYLKEQGYHDGILLGEKLKKLEEKWINNNFVIDKNNIKTIK
jgi:poly(A) polymerase